ncbi:MAG: hypothetical protein VB959_21495, partial [Rhodospirillales bacterium]
LGGGANDFSVNLTLTLPLVTRATSLAQGMNIPTLKGCLAGTKRLKRISVSAATGFAMVMPPASMAPASNDIATEFSLKCVIVKFPRLKFVLGPIPLALEYRSPNDILASAPASQ